MRSSHRLDGNELKSRPSQNVPSFAAYIQLAYADTQTKIFT